MNGAELMARVADHVGNAILFGIASRLGNCPTCDRIFVRRHGRRYCQDACRTAAAKLRRQHKRSVAP